MPTTIGDPANKELSLTFFVDPGNRVYVRHITFNGVTKINDEVLRREMRQLEGGWLSNAALDRSKQRLERLPYIKKVESETKPVAGSTDLVDVIYEIEEGPSAQLGGGIGYSESQSFILSGNYADANFLGTGRRVSIDLNSGQVQQGVRHVGDRAVFHRRRRGSHRQPDLSRPDAVRLGVVRLFVGDHRRAASTWAIRLARTRAFAWDCQFQKSSLLTSEGGSARQSIEWVASERQSDRRSASTTATRRFRYLRRRVVGTEYRTVEFTTSWNYDSRNRSLFADRGMRHSFGLAYALPGVSDVEYYVASYEFIKYIPLFGRFTLQLGADLAYGMDIGDTTALPPYRQFYAGGPETVRGYKESRLGPKDDFGRPFGGNLKVAGRAEVHDSAAAEIPVFGAPVVVLRHRQHLLDRQSLHVPGPAPASRSSTSSSMIN